MTIHTPAKSSRLINATPFFYGWIILLGGTIGIVMMGPSQTFTIGVFIDSFIADLGISRSNISLIYGLATLAASLLLPVTGRCVDRYGARRMVLVIGLGLGLACLGLSLAQGVVTLFFGLLAARFLGFGSLQMVSNYVIAQWFIRQRGRVMGLAGLSLAASLVIFPTLGQYLIERFDWRLAWVILGGLVWGVVLPVGWLLYRDKPELYGLRPDGGPYSPAEANLQTASEENWTLAEARQTGAFWIFGAALTTLTMLLAGLVFHQISLFEGRGLSREVAVGTFNVIALFSVVGNLGMGWLLDRYSARLMLATTLLLLAVTLVLAQVMATPGQARLYGAIQGLITGSFRVIDSVVWAKYFGRLHLGSIRGAVMIGVVGGTALGPYPLGLSLDYLGSYTPALTSLLILPLGIGLITLLLKRPSKQT